MALPDRSKASVERVLRALKKASETYPEKRVGQIIVNACGKDPFYMENADLEAQLEAYAAKENKR